MLIQGLVTLEAEKINSVADIKDGDRLFYELNFNKNERQYEGADGHTISANKPLKNVIFKEIEDVENFIKEDKRLSDPAYITHHNFVLVKQPK